MAENTATSKETVVDFHYAQVHVSITRSCSWCIAIDKPTVMFREPSFYVYAVVRLVAIYCLIHKLGQSHLLEILLSQTSNGFTSHHTMQISLTEDLEEPGSNSSENERHFSSHGKPDFITLAQ
jgi:hypothetical protein